VLGIGVAGIVSSAILKIQRMRLEEARIRGTDPAELEALQNRMAALEQELTDVQERLDFAERLIAQNREKPQLPPASS